MLTAATSSHRRPWSPRPCPRSDRRIVDQHVERAVDATVPATRSRRAPDRRRRSRWTTPATSTSGPARGRIDHRIPRRGERGRQGGADAAAGAGDQSDPSGGTGHAGASVLRPPRWPNHSRMARGCLDSTRCGPPSHDMLRAVRLVIRDGGSRDRCAGRARWGCCRARACRRDRAAGRGRVAVAGLPRPAQRGLAGSRGAVAPVRLRRWSGTACARPASGTPSVSAACCPG